MEIFNGRMDKMDNKQNPRSSIDVTVEIQICRKLENISKI